MEYIDLFTEKNCIIIIEKNFFIDSFKYSQTKKELKKIAKLDSNIKDKIKIYIYVNENEFKGDIQNFFLQITNDLIKRNAKISGVIYSKTNKPSTTDIISYFKEHKIVLEKNDIYFIGDSLIEVQTALNLGGFGILVAQDEWEERKVIEMNSSNKFICSSIKEAISFILEIIS